MDHVSDDVLEQYALGNLVPAEVEKHLLICSTCLDRLGEVDEFIAAMRAAAARCRGLKLKARGNANRDSGSRYPVCEIPLCKGSSIVRKSSTQHLLLPGGPRRLL